MYNESNSLQLWLPTLDLSYVGYWIQGMVYSESFVNFIEINTWQGFTVVILIHNNSSLMEKMQSYRQKSTLSLMPTQPFIGSQIFGLDLQLLYCSTNLCCVQQHHNIGVNVKHLAAELTAKCTDSCKKWYKWSSPPPFLGLQLLGPVLAACKNISFTKIMTSNWSFSHLFLLLKPRRFLMQTFNSFPSLPWEKITLQTLPFW